VIISKYIQNITSHKQNKGLSKSLLVNIRSVQLTQEYRTKTFSVLLVPPTQKIQEFFVDLPFYFYNNPELAIPLCSITKQEVEVEIKIRNHDHLIIKGSTGGFNLLHPELYISQGL
jgi:hypothetical protein